MAERDASQLHPGTQAFPPEDKLDRVLHNLSLLALQETRASSVAIGLVREDAVICRAVAGHPLADVGAPINVESGLAAMAIRREMSQWCSDTESDVRVDIDVCRRLGVRSMIIVPVRSQDLVVGIFAIFSGAPDAFCLANLNTVKKLAHWAGEAIDKTIRIVPPQPVAPIEPEAAEPHLPRSLYQETRYGISIKQWLTRVWRALRLTFPWG
jgi:putative methionine-R-sulfoxide reductase with GAF domain